MPGLPGRVGFDQPPTEFASRVFGDFEIVRREDGSFWELGRGAMGVTYRAEDKVSNRSVALKVIDAPEAAGGGQAVRDRFLREARAAAAFRHPNVAGVFHFGASPVAMAVTTRWSWSRAKRSKRSSGATAR